MNIDYRMAAPEDDDALIRFWSDNSGWGDIDPAVWKHRFLHTPLGRAAFALSFDSDNGEILGQFGFIPSLIWVDGAEVKAYRPVATIVKEEIRKEQGINALQLIILQMYGLATQHMIEEGVGLVHIVPDPKWLRLFKMAPFFQTATFPLYIKPFPIQDNYSLPLGYDIEFLEGTDGRLDKLWEQARDMYGSMIVRHKEALSWKNSHVDIQLTGITYQSELIGFFASGLRAKGKKWQICDIMSIDSGKALRYTLTAACICAQRYWESLPPADQEQLREAELLTTPLLEPVVQELNFQREDYDFAFVVHVLDENLPADKVAPQHWYVSPND